MHKRVATSKQGFRLSSSEQPAMPKGKVEEWPGL